MGYIYRRKKKLADGTLIETGPYWVKYYRSGRPMRESSGSEKEGDAKQLLKLREGDVARGVPVTPKVGRVTIDELIEDMKNDYRANDKRSLKDLERRWRMHLQPFFGGKRASLTTTADVNRFIVRCQQGKSGKEINAEIAELTRLHLATVQDLHKADLSLRVKQRTIREARKQYRASAQEIRHQKRAENSEINRRTKFSPERSL
jgi:hypothetical protein